MRAHLPLLAAILFSFSSLAQQVFIPTLEQLEEYEGVYEYLNNSTLELAASPRDKQLYALINDSKYLLKAVQKDVFINGTGDKVIFRRNNTGSIQSYNVNNQDFSFLRKGNNEEKYWYARDPKSDNRYHTKKTLKPKLNDGIEIGSISASGLNKSNIKAMIDRIISGSYADVHSVLLFRNNKLVVEEYFYEYDRNTLHQLRSATKSVISALTGIALGKGLIKSTDESVLSFFPEYTISDPTGEKKNITIRHLLTNTSGLECNITVDTSAGNEEAMGISDDWVKFTLDLPMIDTPGLRGRYCSGNAIVLGRILEKATGMKLEEFARENLFRPMGILKYKWNFKPDKSSADTYCQLYLRPRDMGKLGLLYMNKGMWRGKQIIPPGWVRESLSHQSVVNNIDYGYLWWKQWLNVSGKRYDGIAAKGNGGQRIYLFPSYKLVAIITGGSYNRNSPSDVMLINHVLVNLTAEP